MNKKNNNKNKLNKRNRQPKQHICSVPRGLKLNKILVDIEAAMSVYLRTGQTSQSFLVGSQTKFINLNSLIAGTNQFQKYLTSGVPNFEFFRCTGFTLTWYPSLITPVATTFEPAAFDLRYISSLSTDSVLPSGYSGNYNESHYNVLLSQSAKPITTIVSLKEMVNIPIVSESNRQCLGQYINSYNYTNYPDTHGGILVLIQSVPSVNTVSTYNPKLGFVEIKFHLELYNTVV
jgi:hypothetical protein